MDLLDAMRVFARVAETGSFSAVARERRTTQPTISKQVAALEAHLGARLLQRTTRSLSLTEEGRAFHARAAAAIEAVAEAEAAIGRGRAAVAGHLRIGTPVAFGRLHVAPRMRRLLDRHPDLSVELVMSDGFANLVEQGIDVAIRIGNPGDATLITRRIGTTRRMTVGAPEYFARAGAVPQHPRDLAAHDCIVYTALATGPDWVFDCPAEGRVQVRVRGRYAANNSEAVREGVLAGCGIAVTPTWLFRDELARGLVQPVLTAFEPVRLPIHAVYPTRRFLPAKLRALLDFLDAEFRLDPMLSSYGLPDAG